MKLNSLYLVLLLIISIKSNDFLDSFSIEGFKIYLKDNGLFQIIQSIKYAYGQDVAIISCEELNKNYNGNCQKLVTDYMEENYDGFKDKFDETPERNENKTDLLVISENETFDSSESEDMHMKPIENSEPTKPTESTEPPEMKIKQQLNYWETIKNISNMLDSSNKNFSLKELESIYEKIIKRIEKKYLSSTDDFLNFLDSSIKNNTKYLN